MSSNFVCTSCGRLSAVSGGRHYSVRPEGFVLQGRICNLCFDILREQREERASGFLMRHLVSWIEEAKSDNQGRVVFDGCSCFPLRFKIR